MTTFSKHLLIPTDFLESAACALDVALALVTKFESRLSVPHAGWLPHSACAGGLYWPADDLITADPAAVRAKRRLQGRPRTMTIDSATSE